MPPKTKKIPSPDELLAEIRGRGAAKTYAFDDYVAAIGEMQSNGYSYAKIADFLTERLGYPISRGQVYRAYQLWLEECEAKAEQEEQDGPEDRDPGDEYESIIRSLSEKVRECAEALATERGYPSEFGEHAIAHAAHEIDVINMQMRADEKAADEADRAKAQPETKSAPGPEKS